MWTELWKNDKKQITNDQTERMLNLWVKEVRLIENMLEKKGSRMKSGFTIYYLQMTVKIIIIIISIYTS